MSKLDELIKELCPNGVEIIEIKRCVLTVNNIKWKYTLPEDIFEYIDLSSVDIETHRIINTIQINADNAPSRAQQVVQKNDILLGLTRPMLKRYCIVSKEYDGQICSTGFSILRVNEHKILSNYLYHIISSSEFFDYVEKNQRGASYPAITDKLVKEYKVPVPPLEVQREIVRILDSFTLLTAELTAELTARKKQYEYYRDMLLVPPCDDVENISLSDVVNIKNGKDYKHLKDGKYPVYGSGGIMTYKSEYTYDKPSVLIPRKGSLSNLFYVEEPFWNVDTVFYTEINESKLIPKYLYYLLQKEHLESLNTAGGVPSLTQTVLNKLNLTIPSLNRQRKIVDCLDNFEKICNDLNIGLPAEIEARRKQY